MRSISLMFSLTLAALNANLILAIPLEASNAYSGAGGQSPGGSINNNPSGRGGHGLFPGGLIKVLSGNAGDGGPAYSGDAKGGNGEGKPNSYQRGGYGRHNEHDGPGGSNVGNAYSGVGGNSPGGSLNNPEPALINIASGNAGNGGEAYSGSSEGGDFGSYRGHKDHGDHDGHPPDCDC